MSGSAKALLEAQGAGLRMECERLASVIRNLLALLDRAREELVELNEAVHSMRGDPSVPWQEEAPGYAETVAMIDVVIAESERPPAPAGSQS